MGASTSVVEQAGIGLYGGLTLLTLIWLAVERFYHQSNYHVPRQRILLGMVAVFFLMTLLYSILETGSGTVTCADPVLITRPIVWASWLLWALAIGVFVFVLGMFLWMEIWFAGIAASALLVAFQFGIWMSRSCGDSDPFWVYWIFGAISGVFGAYLLLMFGRRGGVQAWIIKLLALLILVAFCVIAIVGHSGPSFPDNLMVSTYTETYLYLLFSLLLFVPLGLWMAIVVLPYLPDHGMFQQEHDYPMNLISTGNGIYTSWFDYAKTSP
jgi:hypothetical protein